MISNSIYIFIASICVSLIAVIGVNKSVNNHSIKENAPIDSSVINLSNNNTYTGFEIIDSSSVALPYYQLEEFILKCNAIDTLPIIDTTYTFFNKVIIRDSTTYIKIPLHNYFKNKQDTAYLKIINISKIDI